MKQKGLYTAPAILEEVELKMDGTILVTSAELIKDESFDEVKTMGQDFGGELSAQGFDSGTAHEW